MAFRDHLAAATIEKDAVSVIHGMWEHSRNNGHPLTIFENIIEIDAERNSMQKQKSFFVLNSHIDPIGDRNDVR